MPTTDSGYQSGTMLEAALFYAKHGWPVFPVYCPRDGACSCDNASCEHPAKHPLTPHGFKDATTDENTIIDWWRRWPEANIGLATGSASGVVVLDVDARHGGLESLKLIEAMNGPLETLTHRTGGGGLHLVFRMPVGVNFKCSSSELGPGLDTRGVGGYILAPPSVHISWQRYQVLPGLSEPADIPEWLVAKWPKRTENGHREVPPDSDDGGPIEEGRRHNTLLSIAGALRYRGEGLPSILAGLKATNVHRCRPPLSEAEVRKIAESVMNYSPGENVQVEKQSQATKLVSIAEKENVELWHTPDFDPYLTFDAGGHKENWPVSSRAIKRLLSSGYYQTYNTVPNAQALQDALSVLAGKAVFEGQEYPLYTRVAEVNGVVYLDLANEQWQAVAVAKDGWQLVDKPGVKFRRSRGMLSLPVPIRGWELCMLRQFINVVSDDDWAILFGWMVSSMRGKGPFAVLGIAGEQGSAKSTATRVCRSLIDPSSAPLRSQPKEIRDLMIMASNSWVIALDNLSHLPLWLSDALCRLSTGGGLSTRELYSDADEVVFQVTRPIILNGIEDTVERGDLRDRLVNLTLPVIDADRRVTEQDFWERFDKQHPLLLGALLEAVSESLAREQTVELKGLPRMADFARRAVAGEPKFSVKGGTFLKAYEQNRSSSHESAVEDAIIGPFIKELAKDGFTGTATTLLDKLNKLADEDIRRSKEWPKRPNKLSGMLRRLAPSLRAIGIKADFDRKTDTSRTRLLEIRRVG
jgi:hypothetical protein